MRLKMNIMTKLIFNGKQRKDKSMDFYESTLQWIKNMLLCDEIRLKDIPYEVRTASSSLYVIAFRISNKVSCKRFIKDIQLLCQDIYKMSNDNPIKTELVHTLSQYLSLNDYKGEKEFVDFQKNIYEEVLQELRKHDCALQQTIFDEVNAYRRNKESSKL